ncbi:MAG: redoxin domain-containing protein [Saprospiraceae bacterium]
MKKLVILLLCLPLFLNATKAPNFTVTDYNNKTHTLYADYLNKEKVVVLKIFFVDCPPCNAIAPLVQPAYSRWGAGTGRVQFFELSTMGGESNSYVKTYANKYGITFPGVGADGGALAAVAPYSDNKTFGSWYGTPTFVVIAPNGEVNYRVPFGNNDIVSLDSAIAKALRIPSGQSGGGGGNKCLDSFSVKILNPIQNYKFVTYDLYNQGNPKYDLLNGLYNCEFFYPASKDNYVVGLEYAQPSNPDPLSGISTLDIVLLQKHILGIKPLNNLQYALADVNNNGTVSVSDISELRKLLLGSISSLKVNKKIGSANNPKGFDYKSPNYVLVKDLISRKASYEFGFGVYGDLSSAADIKLQDLQERSSCTLHFNISTKKINGGYYYEISSAEDFQAVTLQMMLDCQSTSDIKLVKLAKLEGLNENCFSFHPKTNSTNRFTFSWFNPLNNYESIKANDVIIGFNSNNLLNFYKNGIQEIVSLNDLICDIDYSYITNTKPKIQIQISSESVLIESNSFMSSIDISSISGNTLLSKSLPALCQNEFINTELLESGIYFARVKFDDGSFEVKKFFVAK